MSTTLPLTPVHLEVIEMLANGVSPTDISKRRYVALTTTRTQIKTIHERLGVNRTEQVIIWWFEVGAKEKFYPCAHDAMDAPFEPKTPCRQFETRPCVDLNTDDSRRFRREECDPKSCVRFPARDRIDD